MDGGVDRDKGFGIGGTGIAGRYPGYDAPRAMDMDMDLETGMRMSDEQGKRLGIGKKYCVRARR